MTKHSKAYETLLKISSILIRKNFIEIGATGYFDIVEKFLKTLDSNKLNNIVLCCYKYGAEIECTIENSIGSQKLKNALKQHQNYYIYIANLCYRVENERIINRV